jgi:predicted ferric reductase
MQARIKKQIGPGIIYLLVFLPVIFWFLIEPLSQRFSGLTGWLTSLGQLSGLVGLAMISLAIILITRLKIFEDYFGGLDKVYRLHHSLDSVGFILILFHPLILAAKYLVFSIQSAALFLVPGDYWPQNAGILALIGLMLFLVMSIFFEKNSYQLRKLSHKFLGFVYFLALMHSFFIPSDISRDFALRFYMLMLAVAAITAFVYRALLAKWLVKKYDYVVNSVKILPGKVTEIQMSPAGEVMNYSPGQFIFVSFYQPGIEKEAHPFSLASSPQDKKLMITVKALGDYTAKLPGLRLGTLARIDGPFGRFYDAGQGEQSEIWVAGGIGVAPFLGMARSISGGNKIDFYYCAQSAEEAPFVDEFERISAVKKNFRFIPYFSSQQSCRLSAQNIQELSGGLVNKKIFLCGPPVMMANLKKQLSELEVPSFLLSSEEFQLL